MKTRFQPWTVSYPSPGIGDSDTGESPAAINENPMFNEVFSVGHVPSPSEGLSLTPSLSFAVPFEEDDKDPKTWFLDLDYIESMWEMFRKVNGEFVAYLGDASNIPVAKERPIGFYHTGPQLRSSDLDISERLKRFMPRPVMVIVDVRPSGGRGDVGIPTDAYFAVEEIKDVRPSFAFEFSL